MNSRHLLRLRQFTYGTFVVLWVITIYLIKTHQFDFFSGLDWICYFVTALAWSTAGTIILFWQHRRKKNPRPQHSDRLNWTEDDGMFAPRETHFYGPSGGMYKSEQPMSDWLNLQPPITTP